MQYTLPQANQISIKGQTYAWPLMIFYFLTSIQSTLINKASLFLLVTWLAVIHYKNLMPIIINSFKAYGLWLIIIWEVLSLSWSKVPISSLINVGNDIEILAYAILCAYHVSSKNFAESLKLVAQIVILSAVIYCLAFPSSALNAYGLKSFYNHKNNLGLSMGIFSLILIMTFKNRRVDYIFLFFSLSMLVLSQSKTSLNLFLFVCFSVGLIKLIKAGFYKLTPYTQGFIRLLSKPVPSLLYTLIGLIVAFRESITHYLITTIPLEALTGRGLLWVTVLSRTKDDLLVGIGQGVFWGADRLSEIAQTPLYEQPWIQSLHAADGGYIDLIGALGFIGLALLLISMVQVYQLIFRAKALTERKLIFSLITFFVFHNITESDVFRIGNTLWFTFEFLTFYLVFHQSKSLKSMPSNRLSVATK